MNYMLFLAFCIANLFILFAMVLILDKYMFMYKKSIEKNTATELENVTQILLQKLEQLEFISSFKESCFIGIGGGGGNIISHIKEIDPKHKFVYINSDKQALSKKDSRYKILLNKESNDGLGCGGQVQCAQNLFDKHSKMKLKKMIKGYKKIYVVVTFGGGVGSGVTPDVVEYLQDMDKEVFVSVTMPFDYEGKKRMQIAQTALAKLEQIEQNINVISNNVVLQENKEKGVESAFRKISKSIYVDFFRSR